MRWRLFLPIVISLLAGFVTGSLSLAEAATNYFAGYHYFAVTTQAVSSGMVGWPSKTLVRTAKAL